MRECGTCLRYQKGSSNRCKQQSNDYTSIIDNTNNKKLQVPNRRYNSENSRNGSDNSDKDSSSNRIHHNKDKEGSSFIWRWRTHTHIHLSFKSLILAALFILSTCCVTITGKYTFYNNTRVLITTIIVLSKFVFKCPIDVFVWE